LEQLLIDVLVIEVLELVGGHVISRHAPSVREQLRLLAVAVDSDKLVVGAVVWKVCKVAY
jgi:hypothetical protein